ncbi:Cirhin [Drechslerella dactyloides]|uniref:Cirhin n=1 Tax=Drechslerella dactyloides TaxID=74499 RepID=A0AAD6IQY0_DREDA|nr:Cirhin [Drechslerella dactyloides]
MSVKRKRSDEDAMSICSTSPPSRASSASPLSRDSAMMVDAEAITQHHVPIGVHSRTLKRWRNARPDEQSVHEYTISKLYSAQRNPQQQTETPAVTVTHQSPHAQPQQRNILSFFARSQQQTQTFAQHTTNIQTASNTVACAHCESRLETSFDDEEGDRYACRGCSRKVCGGCSTGGEEWAFPKIPTFLSQLLKTSTSTSPPRRSLPASSDSAAMDIHRCRFVDYIPSQIHALAFSHPSPPNPQSHALPPSLRLAIGRSNGSIEIWNPTTWFHESTLHGGLNRSIEGLAIGNSTVVTEWDLVTGRPLAHFDCGKGVIWSIAAQPRSPSSTDTNDDADTDETRDDQHITVGCEDGSLVVLSVGDAPGGLSLAKIIPQSKPCRVLSLSYQTPTVVIAGTSDSRLRAFDTVTGRTLATMSVAPKINSKRRNAKKRDTYVWTVKCLPPSPSSSDANDGGWIVAGDSLGEISIYDGKRYTLRQKLKAHQADVLTLETNAAGTQLFSSGVDRVTIKHELVGMGRRAVWTEVAKKRFHRHDVRAMAGFESGLFSVLVSGGLDMTPAVVPLRRFAEENQYTLSALPQYQVCGTTVGGGSAEGASPRLLVARFDREVKIWKMATIDEVEAADDVELYGAVDEEQGRKLVGQIMINTDENISAAAISPAGTLLAISTLATTKLFHLRPRKSTTLLRISKLDLPPSIADIGARKLLFSPSGDYLAIIAPNSEPYIVKITTHTTDDDKTTFTFDQPQHLDRKDREPAFNGSTKLQRKDGVIALGRGYERQISQLTFSPAGNYLFAADVGGWMEAWTLDATKHKYKLIKPALPRLPSSPAAVCFRPAIDTTDSNEVFVMTADHTLHEFNVATGQVTGWSARNSSRLPRAFTKLKDRCFGMVALSEISKGRRIWCYGHGWVYMFSVDRDLPPLKPKAVREDAATAATGVKRKRTVMTSGAGAETVAARRDMVKGTEVTVVGKRLDEDDDEEVDVDSDDEFLVDKVRNDMRAAAVPVELVESDSDSDSNSDSVDDGSAKSDNDDSDGDSEMSASEHADVPVDGGVKLPTEDTMDVDTTTTAIVPAEKNAGGIPYWHTFQYRNILAFQPIGDLNVDVELVVVERPVADVKLPPAWVPRRGGVKAQKFV